jgi:hypothetical protein
MPERNVAAAAVLGVSLALGVAAAGYFVASALYRARAAERYVTVKGFSERAVAANLAMWPLVYRVTGDDLATVEKRLAEGARKITAFLRATFPADEISFSAPRVIDHHALDFAPERRPAERYAAEATATLRTADVPALRAAVERSGDLVRDGVALIHSFEHRSEYLFTELERIKPEMIAEATHDARRAAEQFAKDSGSRVGAIRNAQQGFFTIEDRDRFSPEWKKVRVVTTVQYFLAEE